MDAIIGGIALATRTGVHSLQRVGQRVIGRREALSGLGVALAMGRRGFADGGRPLRVAGLTTVYHHNSHADMILSRLLQGYALDWSGEYPGMKIGALYIEQVHPKDIGRDMAQLCDVPLVGSVEDALERTYAEGGLDGILFVAEHGNYGESDTGQFMYPKREWFERLVKWMDARGVVVPVFIDKMFSHRWEDAAWMWGEARRLGIPLMAGSTLPITWRLPSADVERGARLREIGVLSYGRLDSYGFHAIEILQTLAERRAGGESGVRRVRSLSGDSVWDALQDGTVDAELYEQVLNRPEGRQLRRNKPLREQVKVPVLFLVEYRDGLKGSVLALKEVYPDWTAGWRYEDKRLEGAVFWTQEARPFAHFEHLTRAIEGFFRTRKSPWPVDRTFMTTGLLDALLVSKRDGGGWLDTPQLGFAYAMSCDWSPLPEPPTGRPIHGP